jgi:hypothetical protein
MVVSSNGDRPMTRNIELEAVLIHQLARVVENLANAGDLLQSAGGHFSQILGIIGAAKASRRHAANYHRIVRKVDSQNRRLK